MSAATQPPLLDLDHTFFRPGTHVQFPGFAPDSVIDHRFDEDDFAVILDRMGRVIDVAQNWETAQSMILDSGVRAIVLRGDGRNTREDWQEALDGELAAYNDCWGLA